MTEFTRRHPVCHCGALPLIFDDTVEARCPLPYNCKSRAEKWPREEAQESRICQSVLFVSFRMVHSSREFRPSEWRGTLQRTPPYGWPVACPLGRAGSRIYVRWSMVTRSFTTANAFSAVTRARCGCDRDLTRELRDSHGLREHAVAT